MHLWKSDVAAHYLCGAASSAASVKALFSIARGLRIGAAELFRAAETGG
jgi:hypothetical protein